MIHNKHTCLRRLQEEQIHVAKVCSIMWELAVTLIAFFPEHEHSAILLQRCLSQILKKVSSANVPPLVEMSITHHCLFKF